MRLILAALFLGIFTLSAEDDWETRRAEALNRPRHMIYNTDGCDAVYYPRELAATPENFRARRLNYALGTRIDTVSYSPLSAWNTTTDSKVMPQILADMPHSPQTRNATREFIAAGADPLKMTQDFCRDNDLEFFVSLRVNDTHDAYWPNGVRNVFFSDFKANHPEYLMGSLQNQTKFARWSAMNFAVKEVRDQFAAFVAELCANYDIDGIEYDFLRHIQLFKSVAEGGDATPEELEMMTGLMRELREITEAAGRKRGRPILVSIRVPDSVEFCRAVGIDLEKWLAEKLADIMIGSGYFQLNYWDYSVALARKYQVKFYASLDESRIEASSIREKVPYLPGRAGFDRAFFCARLAAAAQQGCDGVYLFNLEHGKLADLASITDEEIARANKRYFATERWSGGYRPVFYLNNWERFMAMPLIDPIYPAALKAGVPFEFDLVIGNEPLREAANLPQIQARAAVEADVSGMTLAINGKKCGEAVRDGENVLIFDVPVEALKPGRNHISLVASGAAETVKLHDFCLNIDYSTPDRLLARQPELAELQDFDVIFSPDHLSGWHTGLLKESSTVGADGDRGILLPSMAGSSLAFSKRDALSRQTGLLYFCEDFRLVKAEPGKKYVLSLIFNIGAPGNEINTAFMISPEGLLAYHGKQFIEYPFKDQRHRLELLIDPADRACAVFIDGKPVKTLTLETLKSEKKNLIIAGGSGQVGGSAEIYSFRLGEIAR